MKKTYKFRLKIKSPHTTEKYAITGISEVNNPDRLDQFLEKYGHYIADFKKDEVKNYINQLIDDAKFVQTSYLSYNPGYNFVENKHFWVTGTGTYPYCGCKNADRIKVTLAEELKSAIPKICNIADIEKDEKFAEYLNEAKAHFNITANLPTASAVLITLLYNITKTYNYRINPIMVISLALTAPFATLIFNKFKGYPIGYLEGATKTGKSNVLRLIACLFGFDNSHIRSGNDTALNILFNLQQNACIPALINEIGDKLRNNLNELIIKPVYDRTPRRRMKRSGDEEAMTAINSTLIFNTNSAINKEPSISNRLMQTFWEAGTFNVVEAKRYNQYAQYLSIIIPHIVTTIPVSDVISMINNNYEQLSIIKDERSRVNLAITLTGFNIMLKVINLPDVINTEMFKSELDDFLVKYEELTQENEAEKFIAVIRELIKGQFPKLKASIDYKELRHKGQMGLHINTNKHAENLNTAFAKCYKSFYPNSIPMKPSQYAEILKDYNVIISNASYYTKGNQRGYFFSYETFPEIEAWMSEKPQVIINEDISEDGKPYPRDDDNLLPF